MFANGRIAGNSAAEKLCKVENMDVSRRMPFYVGMVFALTGANAWAGEVLTLSCLPFSIETYRAVTVDNVRSRSFQKWEIDAEETMTQFRKLISQAKPGQFNAGRVRCAIDFQTVSYYVDAAGGVMTDGHPPRKVAIPALQKLIDELGPGEEIGL